MARALAVLRGVSQHGASGAVLISGPPGIGKTAVLGEICRQAGTMKFRVAESKCDQIEQVWPGAPVIALLRARPDALTTSDEYAKVARLVTEPLLLADQLASLLEAAAMDGPLLIAIDDLQWADGVSRFVLRMLFSRLIGLPVVWLLASRAEDVTADVEGHEHIRTERIQLAPLAAEDIAAIAADRLGGPLDDRGRRFLASADGNPFLAGQIMDRLARSAVRGDADAVPAELTAAIADQVASLDAASRDLVQLLAVAGRPLPMRDVTAVLPTAPQMSVERAVAAAIESGLILASAGALAFRHDLVLEAVYDTMPVALARKLHLAFADYYLTIAGEPLMAAPHARKAVAPGDLASAKILIAAAETLASVNADDAGQLAALAARSINPEQAEWLELSLRCLTVLCGVQRASEAIAVADLILARTDDANTVGQVEAEAARALWLGGRISELAARADRALKNPELDLGVTARLRAARALASTRLEDGDVAAREADAALESARRAGDRDALTLALQAAGQAASNEARHNASLRHFRELRSLTGTAGVAEEIRALQFLDRYSHAQALLDQARADNRSAGAAILPALQYADAMQDFVRGRLDDADATARALIDLGPQLGNDLYTLGAITLRVSVSLLRGETEAAAAQLDRANDLSAVDDRLRHPGLAVAYGWLFASRGRLEQALDVVRPVIEGGSLSRSYWPLWPCWNSLIFEFAVAAEDQKLTAACVDIAEFTAARNPGVASFVGVALNLRGRQDGDINIIARSAETLARSPRPVLQAFGAGSYGRALLAAGQRSAGLAQLDRAWDCYHRMGAWARRAQVQREMRDAGARYPKWTAATARAASGWESLTDAERRVAVLIGAGHTNKSAASELAVSVNTIGVHLRAVFAKLGIRSRVQLANELHERTGS
jgi:DNA-binding CsgD family transcriptional regulator/tetratricopeptide (TPR) repeat protein